MKNFPRGSFYTYLTGWLGEEKQFDGQELELLVLSLQSLLTGLLSMGLERDAEALSLTQEDTTSTDADALVVKRSNERAAFVVACRDIATHSRHRSLVLDVSLDCAESNLLRFFFRCRKEIPSPRFQK